MSAIDRVKMVKSMEFIIRNLNDESILDAWLMLGVADGDIEYGDLSCETNSENLDYYTDSKELSYLMKLFLSCMSKAKQSGGLYCDNVLSEAFK